MKTREARRLFRVFFAEIDVPCALSVRSGESFVKLEMEYDMTSNTRALGVKLYDMVWIKWFWMR